jgi:queuine tRNA-ribosyltransferase
MGRLTELVTRHGTARLPCFFPDATRAVVRSVSAPDLERCGVQGLIVNTFHLTNTPGVGLVKSQGGIHAFMGWGRPIISDSGGFQAMSMIRENGRYGKVSDAGITFSNVDARERKKLKLTPEKCIQIQFDLGSDIVMCLDDCPRADASPDEVAASVQRTVRWAARCRQEFDRQVEIRRLEPDQRPQIFGIIQGGYGRRLRWECAEALVDIGFDGMALAAGPSTWKATWPNRRWPTRPG